MAKPVQRGGERASLAAEIVVCRFIGAIDADGDALDTAVDNCVGDLLVDQRAVGRQRDGQAVFRGVRGDLENVGAKEWFTAGKDQDWLGELGQVTDKYQRLLGGEIVFMSCLLTSRRRQ